MISYADHDVNSDYRYDAFISYRHSEPDRAWAKWLHKTLETYRVPRPLSVQHGLPSRLKRVFRDEDELPAASSLPEQIEHALQQSRYLIVVCSPRTPESRWVGLEITRFRELGKGERILALLVEGVSEQSFPQALREARQIATNGDGQVAERVERLQPLAADVRPAKHESHASLKRNAALRLLAPLLGCTFDDLRRRDEERRFRRRAMLAGVSAALALAFAVLGAWALQQRSLLQKNLEQQIHLGAEDHFENNTPSEGIAALSAVVRTNPNNQAAVTRLMDALAFQTPPTLEAAPLGLRAGKGADFGGCVGSISSDGRRLAVVGNKEVEIWNLPERRLERTIAVPFTLTPTLRLSPDGRIVFLADHKSEARLIDADKGELIADLGSHGGDLVGVCFSPDSARIAALGLDGLLRVWETQTGRALFLPRAIGEVGKQARNPSREQAFAIVRKVKQGLYSGPLGFNQRGDTIATGSPDGLVQLWRADNGEPLMPPLSHRLRREEMSIPPSYDNASLTQAMMVGQRIVWVGFAPQGDRILALSLKGNPRVWNLAASTPTYVELESDRSDFEATCAAISPSGAAFALGDAGGKVGFWNIKKGKDKEEAEEKGEWLPHESEVSRVEFAAEGTQLVTLTKRGLVRTWQVSNGQILRGPIYEDEPSELHLRADGRRLFTVNRKGILHSWLVAPPSPSALPDFVARSVSALTFDERGRFFVVGFHLVNEGVRPSVDRPSTVVLNRATSTSVLTVNNTALLIGSRHVFDDEGTRLMLSDALGFQAMLWDIPNRRQLFEVSGPPMSVLTAISADRRMAVITSKAEVNGEDELE